MFGLLPQYWLEGNHCDAFVCLSSSATGSGCEHVVAKVPVHRIVLSSASEFFSTLLSPSWHPGTATQQTAVKLVLEAADIVAMIALLKCIYTGDIQISNDDRSVFVLPDDACCDCSSIVQDSLGSSCWQQLHLRVIKLADQYAVHGVLDAAVNKLKKLFIGQLTWPTIEAVLWMPPVLANHHCMAALRHMAIDGVKQKLGVLDVSLAHTSGRHILQALPADVLATLLSCDTLAVTSENAVLAAIDTWLAGPVAQALGQHSAHSCGSRSSSCVLPACNGSRFLCDSYRPAPEEDSPLLSALVLLLGSVRLGQCSGAFLAAALQRMPWLCRALRQQTGQLQLLQQYYSSDSEGRYQLAMQLIQQSVSPPWHPRFRRALPAGFSATIASSTMSSSSTSSAETKSKAGPLGTCLLLSDMRALLDTTATQQAAQQAALFSALNSPTAPMPGKLLAECVMGGYCWRLSVIGVPLKALGPAGNVSSPQQQQLALCIICRPAWSENLECALNSTSDGRSDVNISSSSSRSSRSVDSPRVPTAGSTSPMISVGSSSEVKAAPDQHADVTAEPAAAGAAGVQCCSAEPGCEAAVGAACGALPAGPRHVASMVGCCDLCSSLFSIAVCKAQAAASKHVPAGGGSAAASYQGTQAPGSMTDSSTIDWGFNPAAAQQVVVGVSVLAAPSAALLEGLVQAGAARSATSAVVPCKLSWSDAAGAALGLVPLDVARIDSGNNSSGRNLVGSWACGLQELPVGAVQPAIGTAAAGGGAAAAVGGADAANAGIAAAGRVGGGGGLIVGWQPEVWSRVAYTGELHWHTGLRLLSD